MLQDEILYSNGVYNRDLLSRINVDNLVQKREERENKYSKKYLAEIISEENPEFSSNNLILAPVGSGKSTLIERLLIPKDYNKKIVYLTSNTALKDSLSPNDNALREKLAENGQSVKFFTSENKKSFGGKPYSVHVMSYHEFGSRIEPPYETFTKDVDLIFCDEIHSLPIFKNYGASGQLSVALRWLFTKHIGKKIFYFTATGESIKKLEHNSPGYLKEVKVFDYLNHPQIRRYYSNSVYYVRHIEEIRIHLRARLNACNTQGQKGVAFTRTIGEQNKIATIVEEEGYKPLVLWSINNEEKMTKDQLEARSSILNTGLIPEPYNILIINGAMQEGWNLHDKNVTFSILNTIDETERVQALGRIRKDVDLVVYKSDDEKELAKSIVIKEPFLNIPLTKEMKEELCADIDMLDNRGKRLAWRGLNSLLKHTKYETEEQTLVVDGKRQRTTVITKSPLKQG